MRVGQLQMCWAHLLLNTDMLTMKTVFKSCLQQQVSPTHLQLPNPHPVRPFHFSPCLLLLCPYTPVLLFHTWTPHSLQSHKLVPQLCQAYAAWHLQRLCLPVNSGAPAWHIQRLCLPVNSGAERFCCSFQCRAAFVHCTTYGSELAVKY